PGGEDDGDGVGTARAEARGCSQHPPSGGRSLSGPFMKRVCFVLPSLAGGGAERVAVQVLSALDERRWERSMYLFKREGPYLADVGSSVRLASATSESRIGRVLELRRFIRDTQ